MKLNLKSILYFVFLLPYFATSVLMSDFFINISRILSVLSFIFLSLSYLKKPIKPSFNIILFFIIAFWLFSVSVFYKTLNFEIFYLIYSWFAICFITYNELDFNYNYNYLKVFGFLLNLFAIINIPFLIKSIGMDAYLRVFVFGGKNAMQMYFVPAIFVNYILSILKYNKLSKFYFSFILLDILTILFCGASTGILAITFFLIFYFLKNSIKIDFKYYAIILLIALLLIFNTEYISKIHFLYNFIVNVLHKDLTFTARTKIWSFVFSNIFSHPFGYGYGNSLVNNHFSNLRECHNMFLELLTIGGFPLFISYIVLVYNLLKKNINKISNSLLVMCFSFFIIGLTESVQFHLQFWIIMITYYKYCNSSKIINVK